MNALSANDLPLPANLPVATSDLAALTQSAFRNWLDSVDVATSVKTPLALLEPTALALAESDQGFLAPGHHPLHRLLDWAGVAFAGVDDTTAPGRTALSILQALCRMLHADSDARHKLSSALRVSQDRLQRLAGDFQRGADEACQRVNRQSRQQLASQQVAEQLNHHLCTPLPAAVATFLAGPWHACGSTTLASRGRTSELWRLFTATTERLVRVASAGEMTQARRRQALELASALPRIIERLGDIDSAADPNLIQALFGVEQVLLQIARGVEPVAQDNPPLPDGSPAAAGAAEYFHSLNTWYRCTEGATPQRLRLGAVDIAQDRLWFYRFDGERQLDITSLNAQRLFEHGQLAPVATRHAAFSLALAAAAGIATSDDYRRVFGVPPRRVQEQQQQAQARQRQDAQAARVREQEQQAARQAQQREQAEAAMQAEAARQEAQVIAYRKRFEARARAAIAEQRRRREAREAGQPLDEAAPQPTAKHDQDLAAYREHRKHFYAQALPAAEAAASLTTEALQTPDHASSHASPHASASEPVMRPAEQAAEAVKATLGTWYAFHDSRTPLLAKLAGFEQGSGQFLFTNRQGHLIRKLLLSELTELIDGGQVAAVDMVFLNVGPGH
ncbi:DUF1631 family protein [Parahaliea mediterranea]|uniref:DUF1631 family protein n=1 Tax=Parahaliea mediterranea TaxID=651086 RepID=UPI000E2F761F|nr:DUF1631 family protein [Parahaliea mediterranea]